MPASALKTGAAQGQSGKQPKRGHRVKAEPAQPGAPSASVPDLDEARQRPAVEPQVPPPVLSTLRSRRKPLVSRRGMRVGDPLPTPSPTPFTPTPTPAPTPSATPAPPMPTPTPAAQGAADAMNLSNYAWSDFTWAGSYSFFSPRFLVSPPGDDIYSPLDSSSSFGSSFDLFALSMLQAGGAKIVFSSNRDGNAQIYMMNADGSGQVRLTNNGANDDSPRWSPNGTKVLFQSDRDNPSTGYNDIYVMNSDGTGQNRLTTDPNDDSSASWSPDGSKIVFQSIRNGQFYQVYVMNSDGTGQLNLSNSAGSDGQPSWSPDGSKIAFASERDHEGFASIYVMNANGTGQTRLTFSADDVNDEQPVWSRDGSKITFVSTRDGNKEIYVMNADGSSQTRLTNDLGNDDSPYWSPDGSKIIFRSDRQRDCCDPTSQVWVMNADGSGLVNLSSNQSGDYSSSWAAGSGNQPPVAKAGGPYSGVPGQNTVFNGSGSFDSDGQIASYSWNFGDGGTATVASPTHTYPSAGTYTVTLTVTDNLSAQGTATTTITVSSSSSDGFVSNFLLYGLGRQPGGAEGGYWDDILRSAYPQGQTSMLPAMREFGMTVFESSEYAGRNRSDHWYVYDLYKTYLMRDPDSSGWAFWEAQVPSMGREQVRHAFDQSTEFGQIIATLTASGQPSSAVSSLATARVDPFNQTGDQIRARDCEWGLNLLSLPGRAGLDLGLGLSYSSLVWTRSGPYAYFDEDRGALGPGFRLGFATVQGPFFDAQVARNVYVVVTSSGEKVELRQVGATSTYEAGDSSHLQLIAGSSLLLRTTDGTQISYSPSVDSEWRATGIEDRNGNVLSVSYMWWGDVLSVADTLGRTITFNYDANENLQSITQNWTVGGQTQAHTWATFGWGTKALQPGFSSVAAVGTYAGETIPILNQVGLADGSRYNFEYTASGQVNIVHRYSSDNVERSRTTYDYATLPDDCPRLIDMQVSADSWTGANGVPAQVVTQFIDLGNGSHEMTAPDGTTTDKEIYGTGWQRGMVIEEDVLSGTSLQRQALTTWDQDNTGVNYQTNPRVTETNVYDFPADAPSNRRRTTISYDSYVQYGLPHVVTEYDSTGGVPLRQTYTDYNLSQAYLDRRVIGLVSSVQVYDNAQGKYLSKTTYAYDEAGSVQQQAVTATEHDQSYDSTFLTRGNVTSVSRWDTTDINNAMKALTAHVTYNAAGSALTATDPAGHQTSVSYGDSFTDNNNTRNTFAYPTTLTDADGFSSTAQYNFDFGAKTRVQGPPPANQTSGVIQTFAYDSAARIQQATTTNNGAYTRYIYGPYYVQQYSTVNNVADELYMCMVFDGVGRTILTASNNPNGGGPYKAQSMQYDVMGREAAVSNPADVDSGWSPTGVDDGAGWLYAHQTYDWKGRPLVTTNTDGTQRSASYEGCGCAGDEIVSLMDEAGRQRKVYSDPLGRQWKAEVYDWDGNLYSTTESILNALGQPTFARQFKGNDQSGVYQETAVGYDGYGRLQSRHTPDQDAGHSASYSYNPDDTVQSVTDARGAVTTYSYNDNRRLVTGVTHALSGSTTLSAGFSYDAAGNRSSMTTSDGGSVAYGYDSLSRLTSEARHFPGGLSGTYTLSYQYNLANALRQVSDVTGGTSFTYTFDTAGWVTQVDSSGMGASAPLASNASYRAWGALKHADYGNGTGVTLGYNGRLLASSYTLSGAKDPTTGLVRPEGGGFQYYADGRAQFASDYQSDAQTYGIQDRSYSYDFAGRLQTSLSGTDAHNFINGINSNVGDGPYRFTYSYDEWDNQLSRTGNYWSQGDVDQETYTPATGRNQAWGYDPDGRLVSRNEQSPNGLTYIPAHFTYDAAGRQAQMTQTTSRPNPNPHNSTIWTTALTQADTYDGDGLGVEQVTTTQLNSNTPTTTVTYYLRSSVLGGRIISEYDSSGVRQTSFAWAGADVLAQQTGAGTTPSLRWEHLNPVTGDGRETDPSGMIVTATHLDPDGADAGESDPFAAGDVGDPSSEGGMSQSAIDARVAALMPGYGGTQTQCSLDGQLVSCGLASSLISMDAAQQCPHNDCGPQEVNGKLTPLSWDPKTGQLGYRQWVDDWKPDPHPHDDPNDPDVVRIHTDIKNGHWEFTSAGGDSFPQIAAGPGFDLGMILNQNPSGWTKMLTGVDPSSKAKVWPGAKNGADPERCKELRELLNREKKYGTVRAAYMSSIEFGGETKLRALDNGEGVLYVNGKPVDQDWLLDLYATGGYGATPDTNYVLGKTLNIISKAINHTVPSRRAGSGIQNPLPFQEEGERNAVSYGLHATPFSGIFTPEWMKENCPGF